MDTMYEELYGHIPDVDRYLARIGIYEKKQPDLAFLNEIIHAHQCRVPFENLEVYNYEKPISLAIADLYDKVVVRNRGGYCFELNGLLTQLLCDLGFKASSCLVRLLRGRDYLGPIRHRGIIVRLPEGTFYCDVGYGGPQPRSAVLLKDGSISESYGEKFLISKVDDYWWQMSRENSSGEREVISRFFTMPQLNVDFLLYNADCSDNKEAIFRNVRMVNLITENGSINLKDNELTIRDGGKTTVQNIHTLQELEQVLSDYFDIRGAALRWDEPA